jgi:hypothetical protein
LLQQLQQQHGRRWLQLQSVTQQQSLTHQQQEQLASFSQLPLSQTLRSFESFDSQLGFDLPELDLRQQRRSEVLYLVQAQPSLHEQQQQQQQQLADNDGPAAAAAAAAATTTAAAVAAAAEGGVSGGEAGSGGGDTSDGEAAAVLRLATDAVQHCMDQAPSITPGA